MKRFFLLLVVIAGLVTTACEGDFSGNETIVVKGATELTVGLTGDDFVIEYAIKGNDSAMAEVSLTADWLRASDHTPGCVTMTTADNTSGVTRMAAVTLSYNGERAVVIVNQLGEAGDDAVVTITSGDSIEIARMGTKVTIEYTIEGRNPIDYVYVKSSADWIYSMNTEKDGIVELGIATNTSKALRETTVTVGYGAAKANVTLRQAGDGEILFNAPMITGEYFGDALTPGVGNYWFFLTDRGFDSEGKSLPNTTYYRIDAYGPVSTDNYYISIPNGTYHFDPENTYAEWTFTAEWSGYWVTNADGHRQAISPFQKGSTITVEDGKITINAEIDGEKHTAIYEGKVELWDSSDSVVVYTTLTDDYKADLSDHYMIYECYGDYYDYGAYNWMFVIKPNDGSGDCIQLDVITGFNSFEEGFCGDYVASDILAQWSFIPGWTDGTNMQCSWFFTADTNDIAPFRGGKVSVKDNGDGTMTVDIDVTDDRRNNITGTWTGVPERYAGN